MLLAADADNPHTVTQRRYDEARASAGHPASMRAYRLAARFGVSWSVLTDRVIHHDTPAYALALAGKQRVRQVLTTAEVATALLTAAARLETTTLTAASYEQARQAINRDAARRYRHGAHLTPLPSAGTIAQKMAFTDALRAAGLTAAAQRKFAALTRADGIALFMEHHGFPPGQDDLEWFAQRHRLALVALGRQRHSRAVLDARTQAEQEGRWFPPGLDSTARAGDWQASSAEPSAALAAAQAAFPRIKKEGYTLAELADAVARAVELCDPSAKLTSSRYDTIARDHRLPRFSVVSRTARRHGSSYGDLVQAAITARIQAHKAP